MAAVEFALAPALSALILVSSAVAAEASDQKLPGIFDGRGSADWLSDVERSLQAKEYEASENGEGLQAPNRRQGFRTFFEAGGVRLVERTAPGSRELARVRVASIGRARPEALPAGTISGSGRRVEITRPAGSGVHERFENSPAGLRQTLTIAQPPPGAGDLEVLFEVRTATLERAPSGITLLAPSRRRLEMSRLPVTDSAGRLLASRLEAAGAARARFTVADGEAVYPLTVEFLFSGGATSTLQGNQANARFGFSVQGAGDVNGDGYADVVVGAYLYDSGQTDEGAAFVFLGGAAGISSGGPAAAATTLQGNQADANFGISVAGCGDVNGDGYADVVVGAYRFDSGQTDEGAAFVFLGSAAGIASAGAAGAAAVLQGDQAGAAFGISVAGAGDVDRDGYADVVVGAPDYDAGQTDEGGGFVFLGGPSGIASGGPAGAAASLHGNQVSAFFGRSVAGAGDVNGDGYADLLVGSYAYDDGQTNEGAAFLFLGGAAGIPSGGPLSILSANQANANFAISVAGAGDLNGDGYADIVVGAYRFDSGQTDEGAAFVFLGSSSGIASGSPPDTILQGNQDGAVFGYSVAGAGDVNGDGYGDLLVGAYLFNNGQADEGAAFVYLGSASGIAVSGSTILDADEASANFGFSVAGAGDLDGDGYADVLVGAYFSGSGEGAAYAFLGSADSNWSTTAGAAKLESDQANARLGVTLAAAGDVNGDGYADVAVGTPYFDSGEFDEGAVFVFLGGASGIVSGGPSGAAAVLRGDRADVQFGFSLAGAGDVNGDGYSDLVVGALNYAVSNLREGAAFLFLGSAAGIGNGGPASAAATLLGERQGAHLGARVAGAGDVNGDGYADVLVGAYQFVPGGAAFVFLGSAAGIGSGGPSSAAAALLGNQPTNWFGEELAGAGDVNGDGYADVLVGASDYNLGGGSAGAAFLFMGSFWGIANGGPASAAATLSGGQLGAEFGTSVAGAGDVNGDGYADVLVGASNFDSGGTDKGAAFVFLGSATGIASSGPEGAATTLLGSEPGDTFGFSVDGAGDVDGDGYADIIVSAPNAENVQPRDGAAYLFLGGAAGIASGSSGSAAASLRGSQQEEQLGIRVAGAGDINGDGFADVLVGASGHDAGQNNEGAALLFLGNQRGGRLVLARQFRAGNPTAVQPWGRSLGVDGFDVRMSCYHPEGSGRVKLEVEACPGGTGFGSAACRSRVSTAWSEVTATAGLTLNESISGLTASRLYHWRARTLYAPAAVTQPGIVAPPQPAHGPWRRLSGQAVEADIRTLSGVFYTLTPCRVVDTRSGSGAPIGAPILSAGIERTLAMANKCGIPPTARALSVNLTAVESTGPGFLVFYPLAGTPTPSADLSFSAGSSRANNSMLGLNPLGQVQVRATVDNPAGADQVHLVVDVNGYFE